jgi:hypothetical protein
LGLRFVLQLFVYLISEGFSRFKSIAKIFLLYSAYLKSSSIVEITRFQVQRFTVSIKSRRSGRLEVARIVVDECLAPPGTTAGR